MRTLVVGAGVIGSVVAGRLGMADADVTLLARSKRRAAIDARGVRLVDPLGRRMRALVPTVGSLDPGDRYDLVLVTVQAGRVHEVLPALAANHSDAVMIWANTFDQYPVWRAALGERLLTGFPAFGGARRGDVVTVAEPKGAMSLLQRTLVGDDALGPDSDRLTTIVREFARAGIRAHRTAAMEDWQRCHAAWLTPFALAVYAAGGGRVSLVRRPDLLAHLAGAVREALAVVRTTSTVVDPPWLRLFEGSPRRAQAGMRMLLRSAQLDDLLVEHALVARPEMELVLAQIRRSAVAGGLATEHLDALGQAATPNPQPAPATREVEVRDAK